MLRQAYAVGPVTVSFIERLWDQAVLEAYWDSLDVLQLARWYSFPRVERAAKRLLNRGAGGRLDLLRWLLEQELDVVSDRGDADLAGQLVFPFASGQLDQHVGQSGNWKEIAGFSRTGSRESW